MRTPQTALTIALMAALISTACEEERHPCDEVPGLKTVALPMTFYVKKDDAYLGAVTHPGGKAEKHVYADL